MSYLFFVTLDLFFTFVRGIWFTIFKRKKKEFIVDLFLPNKKIVSLKQYKGDRPINGKEILYITSCNENYSRMGEGWTYFDIRQVRANLASIEIDTAKPSIRFYGKDCEK